ncbi:gluconate 2-dehydrogenase subunit 3 family protein [Adhaeribacter radiodurans]|uniref:Gluconate 2-dehydrogenase subunit 3 family protein n=1 Tax=Adhaeribacter radiodurans TaxID=2745197 RepID=A0A7L7L5I1_9BACT|nr:gluconate 2-dehydrogenase subunit 3 family protein [Adhaeribacter radiodurans]QMU28056.1 gluconate 2-dehydrogenase subunit 3 family protein [Adhaeribacter radiodurans]
MNRREALSKVALIVGGTVIGGEAFAAGLHLNQNAHPSSLFTPEDEKILHEIGGIILPAINGKPGANDANIGPFMAMMVSDCYREDQQKVFTAGLHRIKIDFKTAYGKNFLEGDTKSQLEYLKKLDAEQRANTLETKPGRREYLTVDGPPVHFFTMMRQLTILGFCTSEIGATKALRYVEAPGRYDGNVPYQKGQGAWAT